MFDGKVEGNGGKGVSLEDCEQEHEDGGGGQELVSHLKGEAWGLLALVPSSINVQVLCAQWLILPGGIPVGEVAAFLQVAIRLTNMYRATH